MPVRNKELPQRDTSPSWPCGILRMTLKERETDITTNFSSVVHGPHRVIPHIRN